MTHDYAFFEEDIDLRKWAQVLMNRKWWIIATALLTAIVTFVMTSFVPNTYQATALATITTSRYQLQFDPRIESINTYSPNLQTFITLATSDDILDSLYTNLSSLPETIESPQDLRNSLEVEVKADIINLTATSTDPQQAQQIVNLWVDLFIEAANQIYDGQERQHLPFFQQQLDEAEANLTNAEKELVDFEAANRAVILQNQLDSNTLLVADLFSDQRNLSSLIQDIDTLTKQLLMRNQEQSATLPDQISALYLQLRSFNDQTIFPFQIQLSNLEPFTGTTVAQQVVYLDDLASALDNQMSSIDAQIQGLEPEILRLQGQLQSILAEKDRLIRSRDIIKETYTTLSRKVEEASIASQDLTGQVGLASYALKPVEPAGPRKKLTTAIAGATGFILSIFFVLIIEWWQGTREEPQTPGEQ